MSKNLKSEQAYQSEMKKFREDPDNYTSPGARKHYRQVVGGYIVLAVAFTIGVWAMTSRQDTQIRKELNTYASVACKTTTRATIKLFNNFVQTNIEIQKDARENNLRLGEARRAALNTRAIRKFENSKLPVRTDEECDRPILRP